MRWYEYEFAKEIALRICHENVLVIKTIMCAKFTQVLMAYKNSAEKTSSVICKKKQKKNDLSCECFRYLDNPHPERITTRHKGVKSYHSCEQWHFPKLCS